MVKNVLIRVSIIAVLVGGFLLVSKSEANREDQKHIALESTRVNVPATLHAPVPQKPVPIAYKNVERLRVPEDQTLTLFGAIDQPLDNLIQEIKDKQDKYTELYLLIDSPGGSLFEAARLISAMQGSKAKVNTICIGLCASAAFLTLEYGATRYALDRTVLMSHPPSGGFQGNFENIRSLFTMVDKYYDKMSIYIAKRAGMDFETYKKLIEPNYFVDAEDAVEAKFLDGLVDLTITDKKPKVDLFLNLPQSNMIEDSLRKALNEQ